MPEMRMNSLKSGAMNCGPLSEMMRGFASGYFSLARSYFDIRLPHRLAQIPMHEEAAEPVQNAAQDAPLSLTDETLFSISQLRQDKETDQSASVQCQQKSDQGKGCCADNKGTKVIHGNVLTARIYLSP